MNYDFNKILEFEKQNNIIIPSCYKQFLIERDKYAVNEGVYLYSLDEIFDAYHANLTGLLLFAKDYIKVGFEGSNSFVMKQEKENFNVIITSEPYVIPENSALGSLTKNNSTSKTLNFLKVLNNGFDLKAEYLPDESVWRKILLVKPLPNGHKDLLKLKSVFKLSHSVGELNRMTKTLPCVIIEKIYWGVAERYIEDFGNSEIFIVEEVPED